MVSGYFLQIMEHTKNTKGLCIKTYEGDGKSLCQQFSVSDICSGDKDPPNREKHHF